MLVIIIAGDISPVLSPTTDDFILHVFHRPLTTGH